MEQNYGDAENSFETLARTYPSLPFGKIFLATVLISKSIDFALPPEKEKIEKYLDEAELISEKYKEKNSIWTNYFFGMVNGYKAYFSSVQGKWFSTFADAINAVNYFQNCLKIDSSFSDALIAIGTYKYWKSVKAGWLPFFADEKDEGIQYLIKGVEKGSYSYVSGAVSLAWIYIDQKKSSKAIALSEEVLKRFPENRTFKWILARALEDVNLPKAIETYYGLLVSYEADKVPNKVNEIIIKHKMAMDFERQNENQKALALCNEILFKKNLTRYEKQMLEDRLERIITLRKKLTSLVKEK